MKFLQLLLKKTFLIKVNFKNLTIIYYGLEYEPISPFEGVDA